MPDPESYPGQALIWHPAGGGSEEPGFLLSQE